MVFDRTKTMRNAERFLAQGKIRSAIDEYRKVVDSDPKDYTTMNILGDLYVKAAENKEAVKCFVAVADHYYKQGFAQKAIAIYSKVSKLNPDSPEIVAKLAKLYESRGSYAEAKQQYEILADSYIKKGKKLEALAVWKQLAVVDPQNTDIYLKIGEAYWQENQREEAADAYIQAGKRLTAKKKDESAAAAFAKVLEIKPDNLDALRGFVKSHTNMGTADEAVRVLNEASARQPFNREIIYMLADCYLEMNEAAQAEKTLVALVEKEPSNFPKLLDLIQYYIRVKDMESASRNLTIASEHMLVGGQGEYLRKLIDDILAYNNEHLGALRLLVRYFSWHRDDAETKSALVRLAESAKANNSTDDEHSALTQLVTLVPHEKAYSARLRELSGDVVVDEVIEEEVVVAQNSDEIPTFESFATLVEEKPVYAAREREDFSSFPAAEINQNGNHLSINAGSFTDNEFASEADDLIDSSFSIVENDWSSPSVPVEAQAEALSVSESGQPVAENVQPAAEEADKDDEDPDFKGLNPFEQKALYEEYESIDFYVTQGYLELAARSLDALEEKFGSRPRLSELRARLAAEAGGDASAEGEALVGDQDSAEASEPAATEPVNQPVVRASDLLSDSQGSDNSLFALDSEALADPGLEISHPAPTEVPAKVAVETADALSVADHAEKAGTPETDSSVADSLLQSEPQTPTLPEPLPESRAAEGLQQQAPASPTAIYPGEGQLVSYSEFSSNENLASAPRNLAPESISDSDRSPAEKAAEPASQASAEPQPEKQEVSFADLNLEVSAPPQKTEQHVAPMAETAPEESKAEVASQPAAAAETTQESVFLESTPPLDLGPVDEPNVELGLSDPHQDSHDELAEGFGFLEELEAQNVQDPASAQEASSVNDVAQSQSLQEEAQTAGSFETLKEGIGLDDEAASGDSDFETHFNMGIAYKEMGLLEDAIREFQDASKFVEPSEKTKRHFECCNLLGLCFMEKGMPNLALLWYKKCLDTEHLTEEERRAVNYEIGNAYEKEGEKRKAAEYFGQIYAFDVDYRDVGERLQRLM